jgi:hypothetical protein
LLKAKILQEPPDKISKPYILAAASEGEYDTLKKFLEKNKLNEKLIGRLTTGQEKNAVAKLEKADEVSIALGAEEILFCIGRLSYQEVFRYVSSIKTPVRFRFHAMGSCSIVGSDSDASNGEAITSSINLNLEKPHNQRLKRLIDVGIAIILIVIFPVHFLLVKNPFQLLRNSFSVLAGKKTWTGYEINNATKLPRLRKPVINTHRLAVTEDDARIDYWYAKNYDPLRDIHLIVKNYKRLDS